MIAVKPAADGDGHDLDFEGVFEAIDIPIDPEGGPEPENMLLVCGFIPNDPDDGDVNVIN